MKENLVNLEYACKECGKIVNFSTNPTDGGAWVMGAPAIQCFTGLNKEAREMITFLKCPKCMKVSKDVFKK